MFLRFGRGNRRFVRRDYRDVGGEEFFDFEVVKDSRWGLELRFEDALEQLERFAAVEVLVRTPSAALGLVSGDPID